MSEVTQDNLYLLLPSKVSWIADMLCADEHINVVEAMRRIYSSAMYKQLEQEHTKRWFEGPVSLYQNLDDLTEEDIMDEVRAVRYPRRVQTPFA